jgi:hypothetical protein
MLFIRFVNRAVQALWKSELSLWYYRRVGDLKVAFGAS